MPSSEEHALYRPHRDQGDDRDPCDHGEEGGGTLPSDPATHSYLFVKDIVDQRALHGTATKRISESETYGPLIEKALLALPSVCVSLSTPGNPGESRSRGLD